MIDIRIYFLIQPLPLKGLQTDSLQIHEILLDIKLENGILGKILKTLETQNGTVFQNATVNTLYI